MWSVAHDDRHMVTCDKYHLSSLLSIFPYGLLLGIFVAIALVAWTPGISLYHRFSHIAQPPKAAATKGDPSKSFSAALPPCQEDSLSIISEADNDSTTLECDANSSAYLEWNPTLNLQSATTVDPYSDSEPEDAYAVSQRLEDPVVDYQQSIQPSDAREHTTENSMSRDVDDADRVLQPRRLRKTSSFYDMTISASLKCRNADLSAHTICRRRSLHSRNSSLGRLSVGSTPPQRAASIPLSPPSSPSRIPRPCSLHNQLSRTSPHVFSTASKASPFECDRNEADAGDGELAGFHSQSGRDFLFIAASNSASSNLKNTLKKRAGSASDIAAIGTRTNRFTCIDSSFSGTLSNQLSNKDSSNQSVGLASQTLPSKVLQSSVALSASISAESACYSDTTASIYTTHQSSTTTQSKATITAGAIVANSSSKRLVHSRSQPVLRSDHLTPSSSTISARIQKFQNPSAASIPGFPTHHTSAMNSSACPKRDHAASGSVAFTTTALSHHKSLAEQAYKNISSGLDKEQLHGDFEGALHLYRLGIRDMQSALKIIFASDAEKNKAAPLNAKMRSNMSQIQERAKILSANLSNQRAARPKPIERLATPRSSQSSGRATPTSTPPSGNLSKLKSSKYESSDSKAMSHLILNEVIVDKPNVSWEDIVGLDAAKQALREIVVLPNLRPELFTGLRAPARGVLLFGPPGTGKTMLAKALAKESKATFFSISASTLTSKYFGEGEKMVRSLFEMAKQLQPSVIFIDEIDSILTERSESEHEASRRLKTEFLLQFDGIGSSSDDRVLVLGATNRPQELDEAALRRLVKRVYIPLPEATTRSALLVHLLKNHKHSLSEADVRRLVGASSGYSGSDLTAVAREASLGPIRVLGDKLISTPTEDIRGITLGDFSHALKIIRPSVSASTIQIFEKWNLEKGTAGA
ncbi:hypothetical protein BDV3_000744 [Batrachochytrium dendrobatidis]